MKPTLAINYYFKTADLGDAVFNPCRREPVARFVQNFKRWIEKRYNVEVHTIDCVDSSQERIKAALYFDYNWRYAKRDAYLPKVPFEKRALMMIEPANVNPSLYYLSRFRNRFSTIFTWDKTLQSAHPDYKPVNVPVGAEPVSYKENRFGDVGFDDKKFLVAISRNLWSYMPHSTYGIRRRAYRYFERAVADMFDLYGQGWNVPITGLEKWFGFHRFKSYRGEINGDWDAKVAMMSRYKFALCFENNANQPGYISEKITDCFCARCVPVYYGSRGTEDYIPRDCWIDARDFGSYRQMEKFLLGMTAERYAGYIEAIEKFMHSSSLDFFSTEHYFRVLADGLGLERV